LNVIAEIYRVVSESAAYLLLGFALAGLLHVILGRYPAVTRMMIGTGPRPVFLASLLGLPMPLCSCGVLPAALALRKEGASKGTTSSFLISVPETDIISIVLTYALLGPILAIYRPVAALITAIGTGLFVNAVDRRSNGQVAKPETAATADHCATHEPARRHWVWRSLHFGFVDMLDDIIGRLLLGILIAGALMALIPANGLQSITGGSVITYLVMLGIGVPVYVCATASTPVAVGLIAAGVSPGAAMVFLLAGPATNIAGLFVLAQHFGRWALTAYLVSIAAFTVALGVVLDRFIASSLPPLGTVAPHAHIGSTVPDRHSDAPRARGSFVASEVIRTRRVVVVERQCRSPRNRARVLPTRGRYHRPR
jgi:uncharacterized membrane protein YraQ (UPF0718 family)